jgi:glycosyltransferase involved in cell wall biosynthesis
VKVAYFSPLPPERSGIADYSDLLLPALRQRLDVVVVPRGRTRAPRGSDACVYQIGNSPDAHGWILDALRRQPGLVVLHDVVLHHLVAGVTLARGLAEPYLDAMHAEAGVVGRLLAHGVIDGVVPPLWETRAEEFPLTGAALKYAQGVVVHSAYAEAWVRRTGYGGRIWRIPHPAWRPEPVEPDPELAGRFPVIGCVGHLTPSKRLPLLIAAFVELKQQFPEALLPFAGAAAERGMEIERWLADAGLDRERDVRVLGYVPESRLWALLTGCDVVVALRWPSMGETSGTAIRALAVGRPLVATDSGWFGELPDDVAVKVAVSDDEAPRLAAALTELAADDERRTRMGAAARAYVEREHDLDRVADLYVAAIEESAGGALVRRELLAEIATAAQGVGLDASDPELRRVAAHVRGVGLGD